MLLDIELTMFVSEGTTVTREDDLEQSVTATINGEQTQPVTVNFEDIREYYGRKYGKTGTRIVFKNGAARVVKETYDEVKAKVASAKRRRLLAAPTEATAA